MFIDWLSGYQDYDFDLPVIGRDGYCYVDLFENSYGIPRQNRLHHEGSYSTTITIHVQGRRLVVDGNISRFNRLENLFGYETIAQCIAVYNAILSSLGLPNLTKCKRLGYLTKQTANGLKLQPVVDGFVITRIDVTTNFAVGSSCVDAYIKALSMMPYRRLKGNLHANGKTVDWRSQQGNAVYMYPSVYEKAHDLQEKTLPKVKRKYGEDSQEYDYIRRIYNYCKQNGVVRFEQKIRSKYLNKKGFQYYGDISGGISGNITTLDGEVKFNLITLEEHLKELHQEFINIDNKLTVSAMDIRTITRELIEQGICKNTKAANATSLYAINWLHGEVFESHNRQVQTHRARLRKLGIDILKPCNLTVFSPVIVKEVIEITKYQLQPPDFYQHPKPALCVVK